MDKKVLAIVVTFNRLELLKRCVHSLQQQTVVPHILIINNQSTDGTEAWLKENGVDHITQENSGSAGGWERGMTESWKRGFRYTWMMDDDGFPHTSALEILLSLADDDTACISSVVVKENNPAELVFGMPKLNRKGLPVIFARKRKYILLADLDNKKQTYPHAHLFNGALINLGIARTIGNVDRGFFMFGDEVDYFFRLRAKGKVCSAIHALHYHPDVSRRSIDKKKVYYFIRNTFILNRRYFDHVFTRDMLTVGVALFRILKRNGFWQFLSYFAGRNAKYFYRGIMDGLSGKRINRY